MSIKVTAWVWKHSEQRGTLKLLLLAFAEHANDQGICWPAAARLAEYINETERHTRRLIKELIKAGDLIHVAGGGRGNVTRYGIAVGLSAKQREKLNSALQNTVLQDSVSDPENSVVQNTVIEKTVTSEHINSDIWGTETVTSGHAEKEPISAPQSTKQPQKNRGNHHGTVIEPKQEALHADRVPPVEGHKALMTAYAEWLGYKIPNGGKEAAAAKQLLTAGYTLEQIEAAYYEIKTQPFYERKHVSLQVVYQQIGALTAKKKPARASPAKNGTNGHHPPPIATIPDGDEQATEDDWKAVLQGLNGIGIHNDTLPTTPAQSGSRKRPDRLPSGES